MLCCSECYKKLEAFSPEAAQSWVNICHAYIKNVGIFKLKEHMMPECVVTLRTLENQGYIVTADDLNSVKVRAEGYFYENDQETFCIDRNNHNPQHMETL